MVCGSPWRLLHSRFQENRIPTHRPTQWVWLHRKGPEVQYSRRSNRPTNMPLWKGPASCWNTKMCSKYQLQKYAGVIWKVHQPWIMFIQSFRAYLYPRPELRADEILVSLCITVVIANPETSCHPFFAKQSQWTANWKHCNKKKNPRAGKERHCTTVALASC